MVYNYSTGVSEDAPISSAGIASLWDDIIYSDVSIFSILDSVFPFETPAKIQATNSATIKYQVVFSKKLVVRCTPPSCAPPVKPDAKPPPLGFWTKITY